MPTVRRRMRASTYRMYLQWDGDAADLLEVACMAALAWQLQAEAGRWQAGGMWPQQNGDKIWHA